MRPKAEKISGPPDRSRLAVEAARNPQHLELISECLQLLKPALRVEHPQLLLPELWLPRRRLYEQEPTPRGWPSMARHHPRDFSTLERHLLRYRRTSTRSVL